MTIFAERLRNIRREHEIAQVELGKKLGYGYTAIANYESGRNEPSHRDLCRIADFLDVSVDYLLGRTENRQCHKVFPLYDILRDEMFLSYVSYVLEKKHIESENWVASDEEE